jgi:hypothetical protein
MAGGRKDAHVSSDLGDDDLGGALADARDACQQVPGRGERGDLLVDGVGQRRDLLVEEIKVREDRGDQDRVQWLKAPLQRIAQSGDLLTQLAAREIGQNIGVGRAGDERVEHRAAALAEDVRRDAVQLDAGVFQRLVQPLGLALALGDLRAPIARQQPQVADRLGRHEARRQQPRLGELAQPRRIADIGLAARHVLDVPRVDEHQLEVVLQQMPDRLPIVAGGLHHDVRDLVRAQPVGHHQQPWHSRLKLLDELDATTSPIRDAHTGRDLRFVHVKGALTLYENLHQHTSDRPQDEIVGRQGPREQTRLENALKAAGPGSGRGPHVKLNHGHTGTKTNATSANDASHHRVFTGHGPPTKSAADN